MRKAGKQSGFRGMSACGVTQKVIHLYQATESLLDKWRTVRTRVQGTADGHIYKGYRLPNFLDQFGG
jgi:hypothetical protein